MHLRNAAVTLALLAATTACSRPQPAPAPSPSVSVPQAPTESVSVKPAEPPADVAKASVDISSLKATPVTGMTGVKAIAPSADADWLKAKANLVALLESSIAAPAPGLEEALLAYYRRPDVAGLPGAITDPPHTSRLLQYVSAKDDPVPGGPQVIKVASVYDGASPWRLSLIRWRSGDMVHVAPVAELNALALRAVTYQGKPTFLVFQFATPESPISLSAYAAQDGKLQPLKLTLPATTGGVSLTQRTDHQVEFNGVRSWYHPDLRWACSNAACVTINWSDSGGLVMQPAGFTPAEATERLRSTDGNRVDGELAGRGEAVDSRLAHPGSLTESPAALRARMGAAVDSAWSGESVVRAVHYSTVSWLGGKGYQHGFVRLQVQTTGIPYLVTAPGIGGAYVDHRVLQEGNRTYILVLTETEPRPSERNVLSLFVAEDSKLHHVELPDALKWSSKKSFLGIDARLMLSCGPMAAGLKDCDAVRLANGTFTTFPAATILGQPGAETGQVETWNDLSLALQKAGDWSSALLAARTSLRLEAGSAAALYNAGVSAAALEDYSSALSYLDQATKLNPENPSGWLALARVREKSRLRITAIDAYRKVLQLEPGNQEAAAGIKRVSALLEQK